MYQFHGEEGNDVWPEARRVVRFARVDHSMDNNNDSNVTPPRMMPARTISGSNVITVHEADNTSAAVSLTQDNRLPSEISSCGELSIDKKLLRICSFHELSKYSFFRLRCSRSGRWIRSATPFSPRSKNTTNVVSSNTERSRRLLLRRQGSGVGGSTSQLSWISRLRGQNRMPPSSSSSKGTGWSVQSQSRLYLSSSRDDTVSFSKEWARSYETWHIVFGNSSSTHHVELGVAPNVSWSSSSGQDTNAFHMGSTGEHIYIQSRRNEKYIETHDDGTMTASLVLTNDNTNATTLKAPTSLGRFEVYADVSTECILSSQRSNHNNKTLHQQLLDRCWSRGGSSTSSSTSSVATVEGEAHTKPPSLRPRKSYYHQYNNKTVPRLNFTVPLFGSPPPPRSMTPLDPTNIYDPIIIAQRTLSNWALLSPRVQPLVLADSNRTVELTESINTRIRDVNNSRYSKIDVQLGGFEIHPAFHQPTYRGLFDAAFRHYPTAPAVMYSNMDILYAPSPLVDTIQCVQHYYATMVKSQRNIRGWMIVGQRINFPVPVNWSPLANSSTWESDIAEKFAPNGRPYLSWAEDYFIVSRGLFEWANTGAIPDFVIGGIAFDNWITSKANSLAEKGEAIVVDATRTIIALHQTHSKYNEASRLHPKSSYNEQLARDNGRKALGATTHTALYTEYCWDECDGRSEGDVVVLRKNKILD